MPLGAEHQLTALARRIGAAAEVALVLALFLYARDLLRGSGFGEWQESLFGAPIISSCLLFFALPLAVVLIGGRDPGSCGLTTGNLAYHRRVALRAASIVMPVTTLFPVIGWLGTEHKAWLGASVLAVGFAVAGLLVARRSRQQANSARAELSWRGLPVYVALLAIGVFVSYLLHPLSPLATRVVAVLIFVGFLEEFFFRGYVQSRLNDCFGKPFSFQNVDFGAGLLLTAAIFGLFHPLTATGDTPWAWALWTASGGLVFGFLRQKTGAALAPAMLHGAIWLPGVFFGP